MMKKRLGLLLLAGWLIGLWCPSVAAYAPVAQFTCAVDVEKMPTDTVYIDMLLPIKESDDGYVPYHDENGALYGIDKDSEIVRYTEDGYRSYTFHIADARSEMQPYQTYEGFVDRDVYWEHQELFAPLENESSYFADTNWFFVTSVKYGSQQERDFRELCDTVDMNVSESYRGFVTTYNDPSAEWDYTYCCETYGYAKLAYLDKQGNVLAVSSKADIDVWSLMDVELNLTLTGTVFSSNPENAGPPYFLMPIIFGFVLLCIVWIIVLAMVVIVRRIL